MDLMLVVSCRGSGPVIEPLMAACVRRGIQWGCFFTNDGVATLSRPGTAALAAAAARSVVCEASWQRFMSGESCPVELGSQTDHSAMVAEAGHLVSF